MSFLGTPSCTSHHLPSYTKRYPHRVLIQYNHSSHGQQQWVWPQPDGDPSLVFDKNEIVRVQVIDEEWHDQTPKGPNQSEDTIKTPYTIKGSMAREGLGMCFWWDWDVEGYEGEEGEEAG